MATVSATTVEVDGVRSPVLQAGAGDAGEAVVFLHGNPGSGRDWERLAAAVGGFARAVAPDLPGFGQADKPADFDYSVGGYARFVDGVLAQLGIRRAHLVLHDFGGPFGLAWAAGHPDALASAVLINTGALVGYRWHYLARIWRMPVLGEAFQATATRSAFRVLLRHGNPRGLPRAFVDRMYDDYDRGTRRAVLRLYRATDAPGDEGRAFAEALRAHRRPALVVWGAHDPYIPARFAEINRQAFPDAQVEILPDSGHWPFADDPERIEELVIRFLRAQVGRTAPEREPEPAP